MPDSTRRVILKPPQLDGRAAAQLERALAAAVEVQQALAGRSAHVLRFTSALKQGDTGFYVEHEPARPLIDPASVFQSAQAGAEAKFLLRLTAALFDALKTAHESAGGAPRVHGGLCPGVVLITPDGIEKLSDFGFAQAICSTLGPEAYLNLAVTTPGDAPASGITAVWESLSPEEFEREDRICAFIDPEKYRTQAMTGFEAGSDIITAGFILHLLAEHVHPYLTESDDAHRMVEMSRYMEMQRYNGARRPDLRNSTDPAVKVWCDLVARMLANLPQDRPSAVEVFQAISAYVKPVSAADIAAKQFRALGDRLHEAPPAQVDWRAARAAAAAVAGNPDVDAQTAHDAHALLVVIDARIAMLDIRAALAAENPQEARTPLEKILATGALPPDLTTEARHLDALVKRNAEVVRELARLSQARGEVDTDPDAALPQLAALHHGVDALLQRGEVLPGTRAKVTVLREALIGDESTARERAAQKAAEERQREEARRRQREQDAAQAAAWMQLLEGALRDQQWPDLAELLQEKPKLTFFPPEVERRAGEIQKQYDAAIAEQKRQDAIRADHAAAAAWIAGPREAVSGEKWDRAEKLLADKPRITHWPADVVKEEKALADRVAAQRKKERELAAAKTWIEQLRKVVKAEQWTGAADVLAAKPRLDQWPDEIQQEEARLRAEIEQHLAAMELERRQLDEDRKTAENWLQTGKRLTDAGQFDEALAHLAAPPALAHFPDEARLRGKQLHADCQSRRDAHLRQQREARIAEVQTAVRSFVAQCVQASLRDLIDPAAVAADDPKVTFADEVDINAGSASFQCRVRAGAEELPDSRFKGEVSFAAGKKGVDLRDDQSTQQKLSLHLRRVVAARQKKELARWIDAQRKGLMESAKFEVAAATDEPQLQTDLTLRIGEAKDAFTAPTKLLWRAAELHWELTDEPALARKVIEYASTRAADAVRKAILDRAKELKRYEPLIDIAVKPGAAADFAALRPAAPLQVALQFRPPGSAAAVALPELAAATASFGQVGAIGDLAPVESALRKLIVEKQQADWKRLTSQWHDAAEKAGHKKHLKLTATPAKITDPVESGSAALQILKRPPVTLEAIWDRSAFALQPKGNWTAATQALFAPLAESEKKRSLAIPIGIAAVVIVGVGLGAWATLGTKSESVAKTTETRPLTTPKPPEPPPAKEPLVTKKDEPLVPSCKDAESKLLAEVTDLLSASAPLKSVIASIAPRAKDQSLNSLTIEYQLPGLFSKPRTISAKVAGDACTLISADRTALQNDIQKLDALFPATAARTDWTKKATAAADSASTEFLGGKSSATITDPTWKLGGSVWTGRLTLNLSLTAADGKPAGPPSDVPLELQLTDGQIKPVTADAALTDHVRLHVQQTALDLQRSALPAIFADLKPKLRPDCTITPDTQSASNSLTKPQPAIPLTVTCPGVDAQTLATAWNKSSRKFDALKLDELLKKLEPKEPPPPPKPKEPEGPVPATAEDHAAWIAALNTAIQSQPPAWLGDLPGAQLEPAGSPGVDGTWKLQLPAPWPTAAGTTAAINKLPLLARAADLKNKKDSGAIAAELLASLQAPPKYWPVVHGYQSLKNDDALLKPELWRDEWAKVWKPPVANPPFDLALQRAPNATMSPLYNREGEPEALTVPMEARWTLTDAESAKRYPQLSTELAKITQGAAPAIKFTFAKETPTVSLLEGPALKQRLDAQTANLTALGSLLPMMSNRAVVEERLAARAGVVIPEAEALALLKEIWTAKGVGGGNEPKDWPDQIAKLRKDFQQRMKAGTPNLAPSIFVENFCGPQRCYALAWSATGPSVKENAPPPVTRDGPVIVDLGSAAAAAQAAAGGNDAPFLLDPVLRALPNAAAAGPLFDNCLGLYLAVDTLVFVKSSDTLKKGRLAPRSSQLSSEKTAEVRATEWSSLGDLESLRTDNQSCCTFFKPAASLKLYANDPARIPTEGKSWALAALAAGTAPAKP